MTSIVRALVLVAVAAGAGVAAYFASSLQTPVFEVESMLGVGRADAAPGQNTLPAPFEAADYLAAAVSAEVLRAALQTMGIADPTPRDVLALRSRAQASVATTPDGLQLLSVRGRAADAEQAGARAQGLLTALVEHERAERREDLERAIDRLGRQLGELGERIRVLQTLDGPAAGDELDELLGRRNAAQQELEQAMAARRGLDGSRREPMPATGAARQLSPRPLVNALVAAASVAALTLIASSLRATRSLRRRREHGLDGVAGLRVLSTFPRPERFDVSRLREAGSALMMSVMLASDRLTQRVVMVTSAHAGEGAAIVAGQLAEAAASDGYRTLLVEGDLYAPSLADRFGVEEKRVGWSISAASDWFGDPAGDHEVARVEVRNGRHLDLVPQFEPAPLGAASLASGFGAALERWRPYDVVVIVVAPSSVADDAASVAPHCTGTVLAVDRARPAKRRLRPALAALRRSGARLLGLVWTNCEPQGAEPSLRARPPRLAPVPAAATRRHAVRRPPERTRGS